MASGVPKVTGWVAHSCGCQLLAHVALETDSPQLAPRIRWINSPMKIWAQAESIAEIRNVPMTMLLECSNRALRQFYGL